MSQFLAAVAAGVLGLVYLVGGARGLGAADVESGDGARATTIRVVADRLVEATGIPRGICTLLNVADGKLALELGASGDLLVHGWDPQEARVTVARASVDAAGRHGRGVLIEKGSPDRLPYPDRLVDLVVHLNLSAEDLRTLDIGKIIRVLRPGGKAVLGRIPTASGERRALRAEDLRRWLRLAGISRVSLRDDELAVWAIFARPPLQGQDDWSHWEHGPDNNPVSADSRIKAPYMTQWLGRPYYISMPAVTTAAAGRIFIAMGHIAHHRREEAWLNTLMGRNGYNGTILWTRKLPDGYLVHRSAFIATADTLYMIDTDGSGCLMLDAATGEEKGRLEDPGLRGHWKWIALKDGVLFVLLGRQPDPAETTRVRSNATHWSWGELSKGYYGKRVPWGFGRTVGAFDLETKKLLWRHRESRAIDSRGMVIGGGKIFLYSPDSHVVGLHLKTGAPVWTNNSPAVRQLIEEPGRGLSSTPGFRTMHFCLHTPDALIYQGQTRMNVVALCPASGRLLWHKKKTTNNPNALLVDGRVLVGIGTGGSTLAVDPLSGEILEDLKFRKLSCARLTATPDSLFCRGWPEGLTRYDRNKRRTFFNGAVRPSCNDGVIAANGLLYMGPWACDCNLSLIGRVVMCSAGSFQFGQAATAADGLEVSRRDLSRVAPLTVSAEDWATYRGNNARSASTTKRVADDANKLWEFRPTESFQPTAPTVAGGLVFIGGDDGKVRAVEAPRGRLRWSFLTAGPILQPPTVWNGRVYVGSGDGYVYALEGASGELLWRFRAAPVQRRIPVYGALSSTWPVHSGVLVEDGVAHVAAGIVDYDGTHVYALDAITGVIRWQNSSSGHLNREAGKGVSAQGVLATAGGRLWMAGGNVVSPAAYDLQTGRYVGPPPGDGSPRANRGEEIGILAQRCVVTGGRLRFSATTNVVNSDHFTAVATRPDNSMGPSVTLLRGKIPPAWDAGRFVLVDGIRGTPRCYDTAAIEKYVESGTPGARPSPLWTAEALAGSDTVSLVLTPNAVVTIRERPMPGSFESHWLLGVLDRTEGSLSWQRRLPGPALPGGLAVDRDSRIIAVMEDGRMAAFGDGKLYLEHLDWLVEKASEDESVRKQGVRLLTEAIKEVLTPAEHDALSGRLAALGVEVAAEARENGSITTWLFTGPVPYDSDHPMDHTFVGEPTVDIGSATRVGGRMLRWRQFLTTSPKGSVGLIDRYGSLTDVAAYFYTEVELPKARDLVLRIGSDDGFRCWFNGTEVGRWEGVRGYIPDENSVPAKGRAGRNTILLKIVQIQGNWAFNLRLTDVEGAPVRYARVGR